MRALMESGHTVMVADARYFANFGHLHDNGKDVMMPFWVDTRLRVPRTRRALLLPVSHAEYEWQVRGPKVNADVAFYYGIDGHAEWRTMDELNQPWVLGRHAHEYSGRGGAGGDAAGERRWWWRMYTSMWRGRSCRLAATTRWGYARTWVSAIEKKMTGKVTLFPNTVDVRLFDDPRDAEVNGLLAAIPKDRDGKGARAGAGIWIVANGGCAGDYDSGAGGGYCAERGGVAGGDAEEDAAASALANGAAAGGGGWGVCGGGDRVADVAAARVQVIKGRVC